MPSSSCSTLPPLLPNLSCDSPTMDLLALGPSLHHKLLKTRPDQEDGCAAGPWGHHIEVDTDRKNRKWEHNSNGTVQQLESNHLPDPHPVSSCKAVAGHSRPRVPQGRHKTPRKTRWQQLVGRHRVPSPLMFPWDVSVTPLRAMRRIFCTPSGSLLPTSAVIS